VGDAALVKAWHRPLVALGLLAPACSPAPTPAAHRATTGSTSPLHPLEPADEAIQPEPATTTTTEPPAPVTTVTVSKLPPTTRGTTTTTFVVPEREDEDLSDEDWWAKQPGAVAPAGGRAAMLACIRSYEQNDNPQAGPTGYASNTGNGYYGAYQFDLPTWRSVGGTGLPSDASPAEQDMRAGMLIDSRGLAPWPTPSRRCG
jgi:hypothetical protein